MPETGRSVECGDCGYVLHEPTDLEPAKRSPCCNCGSLRRHVRLSFSESITFREKLKIKARSAKGGRPKYEAVQGDDLHWKSGKWLKLRRVIDRVNNWYQEIITDPRTGEVTHKCEEPLSQHTGHGSARKAESDEADDA